MLTFADLDPSVTLQEQFADNQDEPIVLMILFTVDLADAEAFQRAWAKDAAFCKAQPGFIAAQLHQGLRGSSFWLDYAVLRTWRRWRRLISNPSSPRSAKVILRAPPPSCTCFGEWRSPISVQAKPGVRDNRELLARMTNRLRRRRSCGYGRGWRSWSVGNERLQELFTKV